VRTNHTQRWSRRRESYRRRGEAFEPGRYFVEEIPDDTTARAFVVSHHYSASYPAARARFGLFEGSDLVGVAVLSVPASPRVLPRAFGEDAADCAELGRFVLLDQVPFNGESWFIGRIRHAVRGRFAGLLAHADPMPRTTAAGEIQHAGHVGTIYQASSARYLGHATARTLRVLPDGTVLSDRSIQKVRAGERGWRGCAAMIESHGAPPSPEDADLRRAWVRDSLELVTRRVRHPGNLRYALPVHARVKIVGEPMPYPKLCVA